MDLKDHIRSIPDFPKEGILFYDISTLLAHADAWQVALDRLSKIVSQLQQRIAFYCLLNFLAQVQRGQLQEANGLLQLRCHGQLLADL